MKAAEKMKRLVEDKGISYTFISEKTGIPVNAFSRSFLGKRRFPADAMLLICNAIGLDLGDLATEPGPQPEAGIRDSA